MAAQGHGNHTGGPLNRVVRANIVPPIVTIYDFVYVIETVIIIDTSFVGYCSVYYKYLLRYGDILLFHHRMDVLI